MNVTGFQQLFNFSGQFLFQRALNGSHSYCECPREHGTYYRNESGDIQPIGELLEAELNTNTVVNSRIVRLNEQSGDKLPEPLPMPVMNFEKKGKEKEATRNDNILPLPTMQF